MSMKMIMEVPDVPDLTARINEFLPPDIRLWGFVRPTLQVLILRVELLSRQVRVQNSFNARS